MNNLRSHWHMLKRKVTLLNSFYIQLRKQTSSGWCDDLLLKHGKEMYEAQEDTKFTYNHAWYFVKDEPKWKEQIVGTHSQSLSGKTSIEDISSKTNNFVDLNDDNEVTTENTVEELPRPMGTKKAKAMMPFITSIGDALENKILPSQEKGDGTTGNQHINI
ncbi:hypothetical protein QVD17_08315 [Tagetes erecta]|uniref:No apical meristem-associated C-terminal domain-containing protein n=1 Tax=Tagetes erecta TaxID=13708 RepID=A0AAD8NXJ6_TARER|nr:hypothetical protein QVD17_08315 [Tagetes erecta]